MSTAYPHYSDHHAARTSIYDGTSVEVVPCPHCLPNAPLRAVVGRERVASVDPYTVLSLACGHHVDDH